jgi:hypothetical protein
VSGPMMPALAGEDRAQPSWRHPQRSTVLGIAGVVVLTVVVSLVYFLTQQPAVQFDITRIDTQTNPATLTLEVKKGTDLAFRCTVVVEDVDHDVLGTASGVAPKGPRTVLLQLSVPYKGGVAYAGEVTDCVHLTS